MRPFTGDLPFRKQNKLHQVILAVAFGLLLLTVIPLYHYPFLNPFQYLLSPSSPSTPPPSVPIPPPPSAPIAPNESYTAAAAAAADTTVDESHTWERAKEAMKCNLFAGDWVPDPDAPYYTNLTCWMIQEHQNCMKYGRPDTDYLRWRWKPYGCELPRFDTKRFLEGVRGKSMAFVGDSLARNHMQSLLCLLSEVAYPKDISYTSNEDFKHMFYETYNFTISVFWSPFLVRAYEPDSQNRFWRLYLDEVDRYWADQIAEFDYIVISDGNWFTRASLFFEKGQLIGCNYCQDPNITELSLLYSNRKAFRTAFSAINEHPGFKGMTFLRTLSPDHFENGEWNTGGNCVRTRPFMKNEVRMTWLEVELYHAQLEEFIEAQREARNRGLEFKILDTTQAMLLRPDGHPSSYGHLANANVTLRNDCVHWCLPGPIDMWNDLLLQMMNM